MFKVFFISLALVILGDSTWARPVGGRLVSSFVGDLKGAGPVCVLSFRTPQGVIGIVGDYDECANFYGTIESARQNHKAIRVRSSQLRPLKDEVLLKELRRTGPKTKFYRISRTHLGNVLMSL